MSSSFEWADSLEEESRFAVPIEAGELRLHLRLKPVGSKYPRPFGLKIARPVYRTADSPEKHPLNPAPAIRWETAAEPSTGFDVVVTVPACPDLTDDHEISFAIEAGNPDMLAPRPVVVRRCGCSISLALIHGEGEYHPPAEQTLAALRWHSFNRFSELVALKRFTSGKSGSDVLVFQPRLRPPLTDDRELAGETDPAAFSASWGSPLLVKTSTVPKAEEEWNRFQIFLRDRVHPFMARSETFLKVQGSKSVSRPESPDLPLDEKSGPKATVIGSFVGGELLHAEPFENIARVATDPRRLEEVVHQTFSVCATWYTGAATRPLREWSRVFDFGNKAVSRALHLFGKFDFTEKHHREKFSEGLVWDTELIKEDHLRGHLLGQKDEPGLLQKIMEIPVRFSLVHGDLHPRNILADSSNVWLLDFGLTGIAPTLADFARLEVYLRLWCLPLEPTPENIERSARKFETLLLDHFTATEATLEPVFELAPVLGSDPQRLLNIARCIVAIRRAALPYSVSGPDQRDYLAVLYLTVFNTLRYAGTCLDIPRNIRLLTALFWLLEDTLSRMLVGKAFDRDRRHVDPERMLDRGWLTAPGAPHRVLYRLNRPDGHSALAPVAACRGVLQGDKHHLDALDHTILVLAFLEEIVRDPMAALYDPGALDTLVHERLGKDGMPLPWPHDFGRLAKPEVDPLLHACRNDIRKGLKRDASREEDLCILKWAGLFHDVGKAATRVVREEKKSQKPKTEFKGHDRYGALQIESHLAHLFPVSEGQSKEFVAALIRHHHDFHDLVNRYRFGTGDGHRAVSGKEHLARLVANLKPGGARTLNERREGDHLVPFMDDGGAIHAGGDFPTKFVGNFPLFVLLGYADRMACRGPELETPPQTAAHVALALLAFYYRAWPRIRFVRVAKSRFALYKKQLTAILQAPPNNLKDKAIGECLKGLEERFLEACRQAAGSETVVAEEFPALEEVKNWVEEVLA